MPFSVLKDISRAEKAHVDAVSEAEKKRGIMLKLE
jgi:hypothetical protein